MGSEKQDNQEVTKERIRSDWEAREIWEWLQNNQKKYYEMTEKWNENNRLICNTNNKKVIINLQPISTTTLSDY